MARKKNLGKSLIKLAHDINKSTIDTLARRLNEVDYQLSKNLNLESLKKLLETVNDTEKQLAKMRKQSLRQAESNKVYSQLKKANKLKDKINKDIQKKQAINPIINNLTNDEISTLKLIESIFKNKSATNKLTFRKSNTCLTFNYGTQWLCDICLNQKPYQIKIFSKEYNTLSFDFDFIDDLKDIRDIFLDILK